jgi:transcriptional regulator with XRE-family HTH domain
LAVKEWGSVGSPSRLTALYETPEFRRALGREVAFSVAVSLVHLRKFRGLSQARVAKLAGTSQAKVARIEGATENITLQTLSRVSTALKGRVRISVEPEELCLPSLPPWWEAADCGLASSNVWHLKTVAHSDDDPAKWALVAWTSGQWPPPSGHPEMEVAMKQEPIVLQDGRSGTEAASVPGEVV